MSTTVAAGRQLAISARTAAWAGIVLGVLAAYVALPPLLIRTPAGSIVLAALGIGAGVVVGRAYRASHGSRSERSPFAAQESFDTLVTQCLRPPAQQKYRLTPDGSASTRSSRNLLPEGWRRSFTHA